MTGEKKGYSQPKQPEASFTQEKYLTPNTDYNDSVETANRTIHLGKKNDDRPVHPADIKNQQTSLDGIKHESREGLYLLTIGRTGSGKTTFHWHLVRWLIATPNIAATIVAPENNWEAAALITEWEKLCNNHEFPDSTEVLEPQEVIINISPKNKKLPNLKLGFFEIAGEDFKYLEPQRGQTPMIYKGLLNFLNNENINFIFVFICDGEEPEGSDLLFTNIMTWLDQTFNRARQSPVLLLLTKPEIALRRQKEAGNPRYRAMMELDTEMFVDDFLPNTKVLMQNWGKLSPMAKFSVGSVEEIAEGSKKRSIKSFDYSDIETIFYWLYRQATGVTFGETAWQRFCKYLKDLFT